MATERAIVRACRRLLPAYHALYLFGSGANGSEHAGSDLDLAVLPTAPLAAVERFDRAQDLAAELGIDVDLVDLIGASTVLQMEVLTKGRLLDDRDAFERGLFEARVYSMYAHLNEERAGILEDLRKRGRIHVR
jgi:predicted nucleotidyltransferase